MITLIVEGFVGTASVMATPRATTIASAALIEPADLSGDWLLSESGGHRCTIRFLATLVQNGFALKVDARCMAGIGLARVTFWRASSDGIGLAGADGRTIAFLSRETRNRFRWTGPQETSVILSRRQNDR